MLNERLRMKLMLTAIMILAPVLALAADAAPSVPQTWSDMFAYVAANKVVIAAIAVAVISEAMALFPGCKSNGLLQLLLSLLKMVSKGGGAAAAMVLALALTAGCTTLNISMNNTNGEANKPGIKTDADAQQTISPKTTATIPLK